MENGVSSCQITFCSSTPTQANQETDATYSADTTRTGGATLDAIFASVLANKAFYQWSTFIAAFGQMMSNKGFSVSDASLATLTAQLTNILTTADLRGNLIVLPYSSALSLDATKYLGWQVTLTGNTTFTISGTQVGDELTFLILQNSIGGHTVTWPSNFQYPLQPDPTPNTLSVLSFKVRTDGTVWMSRPVMSSAPGSQAGINNTPIGQHSPAAGSFSSLVCPTRSPGDSTTNAASTAFVAAAFGWTYGGSSPSGAWERSPSGRIMQWGTTYSNGGQVTFPIPFTSVPVVTIASYAGDGSETCNVAPTATAVSIAFSGSAAGWIAVGY